MLFTRDAGITIALRTLLPDADRVVQLERPTDWPGELDPGRDTVVLDLARGTRWNAYTSIRKEFPGRIVILLLAGEEDRSFDGDDACVLLRRPFQLDDLSRELVVPAGGRRRGTANPREARRAPTAPGAPPGRRPAGAPPAAGPQPTAGPPPPGAAPAAVAGPRPPGAAPAAVAGPQRAGPGGPAAGQAPERVRRLAEDAAPAGSGRPAGREAPPPGSRPGPPASAPGSAAAPGAGPSAPPPHPNADWFDEVVKLPPTEPAGDWFTPSSLARPGAGPRGPAPGPGERRAEGGGSARPAQGPGGGAGSRSPGPEVRPYASRYARPGGPGSDAGPPRPAPEHDRSPSTQPGAAPDGPRPGSQAPDGQIQLGPGRDLLPPAVEQAVRPAGRPADRAFAPDSGPRPAPTSPGTRPSPPPADPASRPAEWEPQARAPSGRAPGPLLGREAAALLVAVLAFVACSLYASRSPDAGAGEAAITQVARGVADSGALGWRGRPVLDQPPLAPAAHGGWLWLTGHADGEVAASIRESRLASSAFRALAVGVLVLLVLALTEPGGDAPLRFLLAVAAGLVAALDPVLVGAGRTVTLEAPGLLAALLAMWLAFLLRERPAAVYVPTVGLASGIALLTDGRSVVLLAVPLVFGLLARPRRFAGRALAALLVGAGFWSAFAAWAVAAGPAGSDPARRLAVLVHLARPERPVPWSRPLAIVTPRDLLTLVVLGAAVPALAALWRWRSDPASRFVVAWNLTAALAGVLLAARGALDVSWLVYLVPGAIAAVVLGFEAARARLGAGRARLGRASALLAPLLVVGLVALGGVGWNGRYGQPDDGLARMSGLVAARVAPCSALNGSNPSDPDLFATGGRRVTGFATGRAALAHGVRYFLVRADDAAAPGTASAGLAAWLRAEGRPVLAVQSPSHGRVALWQVSQRGTSPAADMLRIPGGVFENTVGSGCGGFPVVDGSTGRFFSGYQAIGGKPLVGRPLSRSWPAGGRTLQAFDTLVLATVGQPAGGPPVTRPIGLVSQLARNVPSLLAASGMPRPEAEPAGSVEGRRRLLTDPRIAGFYLGAPVEAASQVAWQVADGRFGSPISRPQRTATGLVRQAFEKVVIEVDQDGSTRLAEVGPLAVKAGLVPAWALRAQPVPGLSSAVPADPGSASSRRLLAYLGAALAAWALLTVVLLAGWRLRAGRAAARATATPAPPPGAGRSAPVGSRPASPDT